MNNNSLIKILIIILSVCNAVLIQEIISLNNEIISLKRTFLDEITKLNLELNTVSNKMSVSSVESENSLKYIIGGVTIIGIICAGLFLIQGNTDCVSALSSSVTDQMDNGLELMKKYHKETLEVHKTGEQHIDQLIERVLNRLANISSSLLRTTKSNPDGSLDLTRYSGKSFE